MPGWSGSPDRRIVNNLHDFCGAGGRTLSAWMQGLSGKASQAAQGKRRERQEAGGARGGALGSEANTREAASACEPGNLPPTHSRNFSRHPQMHFSIPHHQKRQNSHQNNVILSSFGNAKKGGHRMFLGGSADARIGQVGWVEGREEPSPLKC